MHVLKHKMIPYLTNIHNYAEIYTLSQLHGRTGYAKRLQLVSSSRNSGLRILLGQLISCTHLVLCGPSQSSKSLTEDWVAEVVGRVHPVGVHGGQVLDLELDQRSCELGRVAKILGKSIGLELVLAGENVHHELDQGIHWCQSVGKQNESDDDWADTVKAKGLVKGTVVDEDGEQAEDVEEVSLGNSEKTGGVTQRPVTKLVCENCNDLLWLGLLNQSIVDDNVLLPWETKEVSIAVGTALASVDNVELLERELELGSQGLDTRLQLAWLQRRKLIEQWQDGDWIDGNHEDLESGAKSPQVEEEAVSGLLDDLEEGGENWRSKSEGKHLRLGKVGREELWSLLVEAELLLKDEGAVDRDWQRQDRLDDDETEDECNRLRDLASETSWRMANKESTGQVPELRKNIVVDECSVLNLTIETGPEVELGFGATVCLYMTLEQESSTMAHSRYLT